MKKILLLGNSHLGALKLGWDKLNLDDKKVTRDCELEFLGAGNPKFVHWRLDANGDIIDHNKKKQSSVSKFCEYDSILLASMPCKLDLGQFCRTKSDALPLLSESCIKSIVFNYSFSYMKNLVPSLLVDIIRTLPNKVVFLGAPCRPFSKLRCDVSRSTGFDRIASIIRDLSVKSISNPDQISFVLPPVILLDEHGVSTRPEFMRSVDDIHANADYGYLLLENLLVDQLGYNS